MRKNYLLVVTLILTQFVFAQNELTESALKAIGAPNKPKVDVSWNRYYDWKGVTEIIQKLNNAYPELSTLESIGKSNEGKDLWCLTITNPETGNHNEKPAFYIDASIHANEIQAVEVAMYTAWYLLESYDQNKFIKELVDRLTFYIVPFQSPDSRDIFIHEARSNRSGTVARDDDGDGLINEDFPDDLNNDGFISQMRVKSSTGRWKTHPDYPHLMVRCEPDETGEYEVFWREGIDNDGDGEINEDGDGYYDPNRNWGWYWRPHYVQYGADRYPFSLPETRAIGNFLKSHPNVLASQSYHNAGGMILRGPGTKEDDVYRDDEQLFDFVGKTGEDILPGYDYMITYKDLYTVYGGETDWQYKSLGIMPYVNELWTSFNMFRKESEGGFFGSRETMYKFDKYLLFGDALIEWEEVDHPKYGKVEVGGMKKTFGRMPPSFLLEEECHRNMAFTLFQASLLPMISIEDFEKKFLGNGLYEITVVIFNQKTLPTKLAVDVEHKLTRPDWIRLKGATVISGGVKDSEYETDFDEQKHNPEKITIDRIDGNSTVVVSWIVSGSGPYAIEVNSVKGGKVEKTFKQ